MPTRDKLEDRIPEEVVAIARALEEKGHRAYLVGGCVRDLLLTREPKDWDIATGAEPEEIMKIFPESIYENRFGTVGVKTDTETPQLRVVEVTTFRKEGAYTDHRHPDTVTFADSIEEDLARRDFTVNAIALALQEGKTGSIVDPFGGQKDVEGKKIRAVGEPEARFEEDALRLLRAVRLAVELDFQIDNVTREAIERHAEALKEIAEERIRDEFTKMLMVREAARGVILLEEMGLLRYVIPELREGLEVEQNLHHIYTVFEHNVRALDYAAKENLPLHVRLAALLHDVGKPRAKRGKGRNCTFYGHEVVGARITKEALDRLKFPRGFVEKVAHLVRCHMFYYNVGDVSEAGVRRFLRRVGSENVEDLIKVREADRIGSGVPKAAPYKLRHLKFMLDKVKHDPISPKMLKVHGEDVMEIAGIKPGPRVGQILAVLLEEVLDAPSKNTRAELEKRIRELKDVPEKKLEKLAKGAREKKEEFEAGVEEEMKEKHKVQ